MYVPKAKSKYCSMALSREGYALRKIPGKLGCSQRNVSEEWLVSIPKRTVDDLQ